MRLSRGQFVSLAAGTVGTLALSGCTEITRRATVTPFPERLGVAETEPQDVAWRVLNRAAFGPRPGDLERVREMGVDAYIEEQLAPQRISENHAAWARLLPLDTLDMDAADAQDWEMSNYPEVGKGQAAMELQQACVVRSVYTARQLQEVMVEFWTDHFNISQLKAECSWLKTVDDRLLRQHALGNFRDLVGASAHSPAMLFYLDNDKNQKRDAEKGSGSNENYARELLELHTLGVDGGYTLKDIQEVSRCLTGWTYKKGFSFKPGDFTFDASKHDDGPKKVLGVTIPAGRGVKDGEQVLDLVCGHPSTARFVARKLCRRFVADRGPEPLVRRLAAVFQKSGGSINQTVSELLHSEEFQRAPHVKLKRPFDYTVSALRAVNADTTGSGILPYLERMGQLPYKWAMPDGYPDRTEAWTSSLLARWNFALDLVQGKIPQTSVNADAMVASTGKQEPADIYRALSRSVLGRTLEETQIRALSTLPGKGAVSAQQCLALLLSTPAFQWR